MNKENSLEVFTSADGESTVQVLMQDETVWLNRNQLAELFDRDVKTIGKHVSNVFKERFRSGATRTVRKNLRTHRSLRFLCVTVLLVNFYCDKY